MKELVWTVKEVSGGTSLNLQLKPPEAKENFYRDIAVIAFPGPQGRTLTGPGAACAVRGSLPAAELAKLMDGESETKVKFPVAPGGHRLEFN
jgi:hypothetical protein